MDEDPLKTQSNLFFLIKIQSRLSRGSTWTFFLPFIPNFFENLKTPITTGAGLIDWLLLLFVCFFCWFHHFFFQSSATRVMIWCERPITAGVRQKKKKKNLKKKIKDERHLPVEGAATPYKRTSTPTSIDRCGQLVEHAITGNSINDGSAPPGGGHAPFG